MAKPKLALIPASQGSKVFSVLPSDGSGDFDFSRSGSATRINSQGLIEEVSNGQSRLNYPLIDGVVNGCPSLLLEPQRTNLLEYSEDFSQSVWGKISINTEIISNNSISPNGSLNSDKLNASATYGGLLGFQDGFSVQSGSDYSVSFFAKKGNLKYLQLFHGGSQVVGNARTNFDLENGIVAVSDSGHDASIENYGNGWFRCIVSLGALSTTLQLYFNAVKDANAIRSSSSNFNENDNLFIWGVQLEEGDYPTSYIPTNGTSVTRLAETANGAGNADTFNDSEGVLMAESKALANDETSRVIACISNGSSSLNRLVLQYTNLVGGNEIVAFAQTPSGYSSVLTVGIANALEYNKFAVVYDDSQNNFDLWVNGEKLGNGSFNYSFTPSELNTIKFAGVTSNPLYGKIKQLQYHNSALTDSELETLTSWDSFIDMATSQLYTIQ